MTSGPVLAREALPAAPPRGTVGELVALQARSNPSAPAIDAPDGRPLPYEQLQAMTTEIGQAIRASGAAREDRIAIVLPNGPAMAVAFLGVASVATAAPLNPTYRRDELEFYLADLGARALLVQAGEDSP